MPPELSTQPNQEELNPEDAKAALGLSTRLTEEMLMAQAPEGGMQPEEETETSHDLQAQISTMIDEKLTKFKEELLLDLEGELENEPEDTQKDNT